MKVIIVGRHTSTLPQDIEIMAQENITWGENADVVLGQLHELAQRAQKDGAEAVVFQAVPGQLAAALLHYRKLAQIGMYPNVRFGFVVSKPGERPAAAQRTFDLGGAEAEGEAAVRFANPNAKVTWGTGDEFGLMTVTVDRPMPFVFSHIEWA